MEKLNSLFSLVKGYLTHYLPLERHCSPNTIRAYQKSLELLFDYIKDSKDISLSKVTFDMIDRSTLSEFLNHLTENRGCSLSTRNHRLHCIRAFYAYAAENNINAIVCYEEISKVATAKVAQKLVEHMSEDAVQSVITATDTSTQKGLRDMFLMLFLYKTGARIGEALNVRLRDIQFAKTPSVTFCGKGSKMRAVPLRENTVEHLKAYLNTFHPNEHDYSDAYLFYTFYAGEKRRMSEDNARALIGNYGAKARVICTSVPEKVHPHLFRHSCAMSLYRSGIPLTLISEWLGHAQMETSLIYAHADTEIKRRAIEKAIPKESQLGKFVNSERYKMDDEDEIKKLCGLR